MLITSIRYGRTFNTGNYTSEKIEIEVIPDSGQTAEEALAEVQAYVESKGPGAASEAPKSKPKAKPKEDSKPPLAKAEAEEPPFDPAPPVETPPKAKRGRPRKPDHEKELAYTLESQTMPELVERFGNLQKFARLFPVSEWRAACRACQDVYKRLNMEDPAGHLEEKSVLTKAFQAEMEYILNAESDEAVAA